MDTEQGCTPTTGTATLVTAWTPPPAQQFEDVPDQGLPGLPDPGTKTSRAVVYPGLQKIPALVVRCPRCGAEGLDPDQQAIAILGRGGRVIVDCAECSLPIVLRRPPKTKVQIVGGLATPEKGAFDQLIMGRR